ncbi:hypothetical protein L218DRAFT_452819 [Marasmius fiardii PR-910]|nr:hypothetical protein L218DRAFT_452819 [Marasmius fiardii PR-910]
MVGWRGILGRCVLVGSLGRGCGYVEGSSENGKAGNAKEMGKKLSPSIPVLRRPTQRNPCEKKKNCLDCRLSLFGHQRSSLSVNVCDCFLPVDASFLPSASGSLRLTFHIPVHIQVAPPPHPGASRSWAFTVDDRDRHPRNLHLVCVIVKETGAVGLVLPV